MKTRKSKTSKFVIDKIYEDNKDEILKLYVDQKFSLNYVSSKFGMQKRSLMSRLKKDSFVRTASEAGKVAQGKKSFISRDIFNANRNEIIKDYLVNNVSPRELGMKYGISEHTLSTWLKNLGIRRSNKESRYLNSPSKQIINENSSAINSLYIDESNSISELMSLFKVNRKSLEKHFKSEGIYRNLEDANKVSLSKSGKRGRSSQEFLFEKYLFDNNIKFKPQFSPDNCKYTYDFYLIDKNLIVEIDGIYWHRLGKFSKYPGHEKRHRIDKLKTQVALGLGYKIIRVTDEQINRDRELLFKEMVK